MRRHLPLVALSILATAALAGCSYEDEGTPAPSATAALPAASASATIEATPTPSATEAVTATPSASPTEAATEMPSASPSATSPATPAVTVTPAATPAQPVATAVPTQTAAPTKTAAPTPTAAPTQTAAPAPSGGTVEIRGFGFPYELHVAAGSTVTWINRDAVPHDVVAFDGSWSSALFNEGESYSHTFTAAGRQPYKCTIHPYMQATIVVD